jgi:hypothetical protein
MEPLKISSYFCYAECWKGIVGEVRKCHPRKKEDERILKYLGSIKAVDMKF